MKYVFRSALPRWKRILGAISPIILLLFFGSWLFVGWQTVSVSCTRSAPSVVPDCSITEEHLFGLYQRHAVASGVERVGIVRHESTDRSMGSGMSRKVFSRQVVLSAANGAVPLSLLSSNVDDAEQETMESAIRTYLHSTDPSFSGSFVFRNVFGYVGSVGTLVAVWLLWLVIKGTFLPQMIRSDDAAGTFVFRTRQGDFRTKKILRSEIVSVRIAENEEAATLTYPRLSKMGGTPVLADPMIVLETASGGMIAFPNFTDTPIELLRKIVGEIDAARNA